MTTSPADAEIPRVVIMSDGSALPAGTDLAALLYDDAESITGLATIRACPAISNAIDAASLAADVRALPADIRAVLLTRVEPERARRVQQELQDVGARLIVTDEDTAAITMAAATLNALAKSGRRARGNRVALVAGQDEPLLTTVLIAAGITDITTWSRSDAETFPLHTIVVGADVVIDLAGDVRSRAPRGLGAITVLTRDDAGSTSYAAAGLLHAATLAPGLVVDTEVYRACARALAALSKSGTPATAPTGRALAQLFADAAISAVRTQHDS